MDVVPGIQRQGVAAGPGDPVLDEDVAIAGPVTGTAGGAGAAGRGVGGLDGDVVAFQGRRQGGAGDVAARGGDGEVVGIDQPATSGTVGGAGGDSGAVGDPDVGGTGLDEAAVAAIGGTGVQGAVDDGAAGLHAAEQNDATLAVGDGPCLHDAGVVARAGQQAVAGTGAHQHLAAVGDDQLVVRGQGLDLAALHLHAGQAAAFEVQDDGIAASQGNGAQSRGDH